MTEHQTHADLLRWYAEMGVDCAIEETPQDRFAEAAQPEVRIAPPSETPPPPAPPPRPASTQPDRAPTRPVGDPLEAADTVEATGEAARAVANAATTLDELRTALEAFEGCALKTTATQVVFADGNPGARLMLIGEAPGREEDLQGLPFVGRSGQLLDRMLAAIGLDRTSTYIANIVPWRPPGNRTPTPLETAACRPFIDRQIELVAPDVLVCLGAAAAKEILATTDGILRLRGRWRTAHINGREVRTMATLHPAYLLRQPGQKRLAWRDLLAIREALAEGG